MTKDTPILSEPYRVVTPWQYRKGYTVYLGAQIPNTEQHAFELVRKLNDGNYLVKNPAAPTEKGAQHEKS